MQLSYLENGLQKHFMQSDNDSDDCYLLRKFHIKERNKYDYLYNLKSSFNIQRHKDTAEFLLCARYLVYLFNYEPQYADLVKQFRPSYIRMLHDGIYQSQKCLKLLCQLLLDQNQNFLQKIQEDIQSNKIYTKEASIVLNLKILEGKMKWQLQKRKKIRNVGIDDKMQIFIEHAIHFICTKITSNINNTIICYKMKLLSLIFDFKGPQIIQFEQFMKEALKQWLNIEFYNEENLNILFLIIQKYVTHFNTKTFDIIIPYIYNKMNHLDNENFLNIIKFISQSYNKRQPKELNELFKRIQQNMMEMMMNSHEYNDYQVKWKMIDLLIIFYQKLDIKFSKKMMNAIMNNGVQNKFLCGLIIAIAAVYRPKIQLNQDSIDNINAVSSLDDVFSDKKMFQFYHQFICDFSILHNQFQDFICNPQASQGIILILLAIKTTVVANYRLITEFQLQQHLIITLLKFILIDKHSTQCMQILKQLMKQFEIHKYSINGLSISLIVKEMMPLILKKIQNQVKVSQNLFTSLYTVFQIINNYVVLQQLESFNIFSVCLELIVEIPHEYYDVIFFKQSTQLLELVLPHEKALYLQPHFLRNHQFFMNFIEIMINYPNTQFFRLYLILLNNLKSGPNNQFLQYKRADIKAIYNSDSQDDSYVKFFDNYNIIEYIIHQQPYNNDAWAYTWHIFYKNISHLTFENNYDLFDLLHYFRQAHDAQEERLRYEFVVRNDQENIFRCLDIIKMLNRMIEQAVFYREIEEIVQFRLRMSIHLIEVFHLFYEIAQGQVDMEELKGFLNQSCCQYRIEAFRNIFKGNQNLQKAKQYWNKNQFIFFILSPLVNSFNNEISVAPDQMMSNLQRNFERLKYQTLTNTVISSDYIYGGQSKRQSKVLKNHLDKLQLRFMCNFFRWFKAIQLRRV